MKNDQSKVNFIISYICDKEDTHIGTLRSKSRLAELVRVRKYFCYFTRKYTDLNFREIGSIINRDHATVMHSIASVEGFIMYDEKIRDKISKYDTIFKSQLKEGPEYIHESDVSAFKIKVKELEKELKQIKEMLCDDRITLEA